MFNAGQIRSDPIYAKGAVIGVHFPYYLSDTKVPRTISLEGPSSPHKLYFPIPLSDIKKDLGTNAKALPTLWSKEDPDHLLFAMAHSNRRDGYGIQVGHRIPFTDFTYWTKVDVDGGTYGRILAENEHFKKALEAHPDARLIQLSCEAAAGPHARMSAEALHSSAIPIDVNATKYACLTWEDGTSGYLVKHTTTIHLLGVAVPSADAKGSETSPWVEYKASAKRADP